MELGKPIRTVVVEPLADPKQQDLPKPLKQPCVRPTTPTR
jgi:hypothetical protein